MEVQYLRLVHTSEVQYLRLVHTSAVPSLILFFNLIDCSIFSPPHIYISDHNHTGGSRGGVRGGRK